MAIIGIDDTDSRTEGMCTTYVGHLINKELSKRGYTVTDTLLIRLNPAAKYKTRGNAAVAIHTEEYSDEIKEVVTDIVFKHSRTDDEITNPGIVISKQNEISDEVGDFTIRAIRELLEIETAEDIINRHNFISDYLGVGRGRIGALAAVGAKKGITDWTYENISYRQEEKWGTKRDVDMDSLFDAANTYYPDAWDTVDRTQGEGVCVPHTPCPILYGIRGNSEQAVKELTYEINGENVLSSQLFKTNQGTDIHLHEIDKIENVQNDKAFKVTGRVKNKPETKEGGHVFFTIADDSSSLDVVAFEPTKHFRDVIRKLREGDKVLVCGEVKKDALKLEKIKIVELNETKKVNPTCPDCGNSMSSAGKNQGYRCKSCSNKESEKVTKEVKRGLELGWYEVPPCARRHIAKPLVRGGFDGNINKFK